MWVGGVWMATHGAVGPGRRAGAGAETGPAGIERIRPETNDLHHALC